LCAKFALKLTTYDLELTTMLSYQHIYHAGNLADVHKHMALATVIERMMKPGKPITYIETHAGRGVYNLDSAESTKTGEAETGIRALYKKIPREHPYSKVIAEVRKEYGKSFYPGSPYIARELLTKSQLHLCELHPREFAELKKNVSGANLHFKNGYDAALAISPPKVRRGLVLVDPSYEVKSEYIDAANFALDIIEKWPQAVVMVWYPILDAGNHLKLLEMLDGGWKQEVMFKNSPRIRGSGLICANLRVETVKELEKIPLIF
jgi:23S rRNA (adenine2030-N6)-methyltransferase